MKQTGLGSTSLLNIEVLKDSQGFAALEGEWEDLYRNAPLATPFQSWAWLYSWWESYGEGYVLRLVTIRDEGLLVGLIPLMLERRWGFFGKLLFIGSGITDYLDMLAREGWEVLVSQAGRQALERIDGWHVADLQQLRPEALAWDIFEAWDGPRARIWQDNSSVVGARPWDELLSSLSRNLRSTVRRTIRRAEADNVRAELVRVDDAEEAARRLEALSRELWRERWREYSPEFCTQRYESFLQTAASRMTARGLGGISELRRDGGAIASQFLIFGRNFTQVHKLGASNQALRQYQFSSLLIWDGVNVARDKNSELFDLGRGREPYKLRWRSGVILIHTAILGRRLSLWSLYAGYHLLRSTAKRYVYSENPPQWIRVAADRYRMLRYALTRHVRVGKRS